MLNIVLITVILILLSTLVYLNMRRELFQSSSSVCSFFPENDPNVTNSTECYNRCLTFYMSNPTNNPGCIDQISANNCINKCQNFVPSSLSPNGEIRREHCTISQNDIYGPNIRSCVTNCENYGGNVCRQYKLLNSDGTISSQGNYVIGADPAQSYSDNCDINDPTTYQHCSPCVQKCMTCTDSCK